MKKKLLLLGLMFSLLLSGCGAADTSADSIDAVTSAQAKTGSTNGAGEKQEAASPEAPADETEAPAEGRTATLYIGTKASGFQEYEFPYEGELTPELLIQGISDLTGWNLTLDEPVSTGKGGMSVCLSEESALFVGPPEPQKEEFFVFGAEELAEIALDSIQATLQRGFTGEGGDPDALDIYYYMEGDKPLELPDLGLSWPVEEPYQWKTPA